MRRLDQRGVASFEFIIVAVPLFFLMFIIMDLGRYAITIQSLRALANAGARATMIQCYTPAEIRKTSPATCTDVSTYLNESNVQIKTVAPFLYAGGLSPTLVTTSGAAALTVTASQSGFKMVMPIWGKSLNAPSASTELPF